MVYGTAEDTIGYMRGKRLLASTCCGEGDDNITDDIDGSSTAEEATDPDTIVEDVVSHFTPSCIPIEPRQCDKDEDTTVEEFFKKGCSCIKWNGKECFQQFPLHYFKSTRLAMRDLDRDQLDMVLMGQILAFSNTSKMVVTECRHIPTERKKLYTSDFFHQGKAVCVRLYGNGQGLPDSSL